MTKIRWGEPDPNEEIWYKICEGNGCLVILELPFEKYKNTRYCSACYEKWRNEYRREYMKQKRLEARNLAYGDSIDFDEI